MQGDGNLRPGESRVSPGREHEAAGRSSIPTLQGLPPDPRGLHALLPPRRQPQSRRTQTRPQA